MFPYFLGIRLPLFQSTWIYMGQRSQFSTNKDTNKKSSLRIGIQGVCLELGQRKLGVSKGPEKLRSTGFIQVLRDAVQADVVDYGDVNMQRFWLKSPTNMFLDTHDKESTFPLNAEGISNSHQTHRLWKRLVSCRNVHEVGAASRAIFESTQKILRDGRICLTLGGDHSLAIGTLAGASRIHRNLGVIWIDAHSDINTPFTSNSGNLHGMVLSFHLREMIPYMPKYPEFSFFTPWLSSKDLVYIGLRDVEPFEKYFIEKLGIKSFSMKDVDKLGMNAVIEQTLDHLFSFGNKRPLHVSVDVDAIDPHDIPSTGTPVPGGLTLREGMHMLEEIEHTGLMVALDIVELNPLIATEYHATRSAHATEELIFSCFQYCRNGMPSLTEPPMPKQEVSGAADPVKNNPKIRT